MFDPSRPEEGPAEALERITTRLRLADRLLYAVSPDAVGPGRLIHAKETDWNYEFFVFHSQAEAEQFAASVGRQLLHMRDAPTKPPPWPTPTFAERLEGLGELRMVWRSFPE